jgi:hypothetical protein
MNDKLVHCLIAALLLAGCGGAKLEAGSKSQKGGPGDTLGRIDQNPRCEKDKGREVLLDLNQDGQPDVRKIYREGAAGEILICRDADLNFDGKWDLHVFFDPDTGLKKRDEVDLDYDGTMDIVTTFVGGKPIKQELDTNSDGLIDRVRFLDGNVPQRVEGDTDGDGRIDYWEYYEGGKLVRVGMDTTGDGRADTWNRDQETEDAVLTEEEAAPAEEEGAKEPKKAVAGGAVEEDPYGPAPAKAKTGKDSSGVEENPF